MLKHQLIHPELNAILARSGHHARVLIADGNYPMNSKHGPRAEFVHLNRIPGVVSCNDVLKAVLSAVQVEVVNTMAYEPTDPHAQGRDEEPPVWSAYRQTLQDDGYEIDLEPIKKWEFYEAVEHPDHILTIQTGDQHHYVNILLTLGVRPDAI